MMNNRAMAMKQQWSSIGLFVDMSNDSSRCLLEAVSGITSLPGNGRYTKAAYTLCLKKVHMLGLLQL